MALTIQVLIYFKIQNQHTYIGIRCEKIDQPQRETEIRQKMYMHETKNEKDDESKKYSE